MADNPFTALSRVMHEPNRLAIISALAAAVDGLSFGELKAACNLTDGNLNRHLKALEEEEIIAQHKDAPGGKRPRTTITLTPGGRKRFVKYLATLEEVLAQAAASVGSPSPASSIATLRPGQI
jgi:DNA-binding transcriptional ArsR family regulator